MPLLNKQDSDLRANKPGATCYKNPQLKFDLHRTPATGAHWLGNHGKQSTITNAQYVSLKFRLPSQPIPTVTEPDCTWLSVPRTPHDRLNRSTRPQYSPENAIPNPISSTSAAHPANGRFTTRFILTETPPSSSIDCWLGTTFDPMAQSLAARSRKLIHRQSKIQVRTAHGSQPRKTQSRVAQW